MTDYHKYDANLLNTALHESYMDFYNVKARPLDYKNI